MMVITLPSNVIAVKHNIEVAHRLFERPGKCENIHGHSMWVKLELRGELDEHGILDGIDFGSLKKDFRDHLDNVYDHHLLLNGNDPWAKALKPLDLAVATMGVSSAVYNHLPGLQTFPSDPTTENIAKWIAMFMRNVNGYNNVSSVEVWETSVNMGRWEA